MTDDPYVNELIQTAAVAVAAAEDAIQGTTAWKGHPQPETMITRRILDMVENERRRQDEQWGYARHHHPTVWMTVLGEEYGEACQAALDQHVHPQLQGR